MSLATAVLQLQLSVYKNKSILDINIKENIMNNNEIYKEHYFDWAATSPTDEDILKESVANMDKYTKKLLYKPR